MKINSIEQTYLKRRKTHSKGETMKTYMVSFWYEEGGQIQVKAKTRKQAEKTIREILEEDGTNNLKYETVHRDYGIADSEELV